MAGRCSCVIWLGIYVPVIDGGCLNGDIGEMGGYTKVFEDENSEDLILILTPETSHCVL